MSKDMPLLRLKNVSKFYYNSGLVASGFTKVNIDFDIGEFVAITGESGSGKSTLLNVLSGLDTYEEGEMYINGEETSHYSELDFEKYRKTYIGNIFQSFNLVNSYTVYQNVELVLLLNGYKKKDIKEKIINLIKDVDLYKYRNTKVSRLSGGQKQRVAIARALAKDTPIIIADEPTGNLDSKAAKSVLKTLSEIAKDKLVIVVTHNYEQIEEYATRKIEMHDGKVREDQKLKKYQKSDTEVFEYKDIKLLNKIRLGVRNTFNIPIKFILMFIVFLFITLSFLGEYSSFKNSEYQEISSGYNWFFQNLDDKRIIITKNDKTSFTDEDYEKIKNIKYVKTIEKDDILLDTQYDLNNDNYYFSGYLSLIDSIDNVDEGRMPENDNEVVLKGYKYDYYFSTDLDNLWNQELILSTNGNNISEEKFKVVGVIYTDDWIDTVIYLKDNMLSEARKSTNILYSTTNVTINNNTLTSENYNYNIVLIPNKNISDGVGIIDYNLNYLCKYNWCNNSTVSINVKNLYYEENLDVKISSMYTKYNYKNLLGVNSINEYTPALYISENDYNKLYNKDSFQSSVFVDNAQHADKVIEELNNLNIKTLPLKDAIVNDAEDVLAVIKIFKLIILVILFIVLFFISYFVIKLIQKSKNVYYATVRILGGSKKSIKDLIKIELYTVFNLTYILTIIFVFLVRKEIINFKYIYNLTEFLELKDYILIYILMFIMSFLMANRYSTKLFKTSAMKAYNEEV